MAFATKIQGNHHLQVAMFRCIMHPDPCGGKAKRNAAISHFWVPRMEAEAGPQHFSPVLGQWLGIARVDRIDPVGRGFPHFGTSPLYLDIVAGTGKTAGGYVKPVMRNGCLQVPAISRFLLPLLLYLAFFCPGPSAVCHFDPRSAKQGPHFVQDASFVQWLRLQTPFA